MLFESAAAGAKIGRTPETSELFRASETCVGGRCSAFPKTQESDFADDKPFSKYRDGESPVIGEEAPRSVGEIKTPVKNSRLKPLKSIVPKVRKSIQRLSFVRQQWFKYTINREAEIIKQLEALGEKHIVDETIPQLTAQLQLIQQTRTDLNPFYGIAHISYEFHADIIRDFEKQMTDLETLVGRELTEISVAHKSDRNTRMVEILKSIKLAENLKLDKFENMKDIHTISELQTWWIFPPGRDNAWELMKSIFRSKKGVQAKWIEYRKGLGERAKDLFAQSEAVTKEPLAQKAQLTLEHDLEARQNLAEFSNYREYLTSTQESMDFLREFNRHLKDNNYESDLKSINVLQEYLIYLGVSRGPMTFVPLREAMPEVYDKVAKISAGVFPPKLPKAVTGTPPLSKTTRLDTPPLVASPEINPAQ